MDPASVQGVTACVQIMFGLEVSIRIEAGEIETCGDWGTQPFGQAPESLYVMVSFGVAFGGFSSISALRSCPASGAANRWYQAGP